MTSLSPWQSARWDRPPSWGPAGRALRDRPRRWRPSHGSRVQPASVGRPLPSLQKHFHFCMSLRLPEPGGWTWSVPHQLGWHLWGGLLQPHTHPAWEGLVPFPSGPANTVPGSRETANKGWTRKRETNYVLKAGLLEAEGEKAPGHRACLTGQVTPWRTCRFWLDVALGLPRGPCLACGSQTGLYSQ